MNLKDAIREAVDERAKQENSLSLENEAASPVTTSPVTTSPVTTQSTEHLTSDTASHKAVNTASSKKTGVSDRTPKNSRPQTPAIAASSVREKREEVEDTAIESTQIESPETAALTIRVPRTHRVHWLISAKKEGTSLTAAIAEALSARFGEPRE